LVNQAVRLSLKEDAEDLAAFEERAGEPNLLFEDVVKDLKHRGELQSSYKPSTVKELERIPRKKDQQRIVERISALADDPRPQGSQKLSGKDRFRLRQGSYPNHLRD
jgi:hypothetical protein